MLKLTYCERLKRLMNRVNLELALRKDELNWHIKYDYDKVKLLYLQKRLNDLTEIVKWSLYQNLEQTELLYYERVYMMDFII
jgi:hypothetical protein